MSLSAVVPVGGDRAGSREGTHGGGGGHALRVVGRRDPSSWPATGGLGKASHAAAGVVRMSNWLTGARLDLLSFNRVVQSLRRVAVTLQNQDYLSGAFADRRILRNEFREFPVGGLLIRVSVVRAHPGEPFKSSEFPRVRFNREAED
ncbi:MAG: hypothetical protein ACK506_16105 [Pirellula sp.]